MRTPVWMILTAASIVMAQSPDRAARLALLNETLAQKAADYVVSVRKPSSQPGLRDLTHAAYALAATGGSVADAESLLVRAFSQQRMDSAKQDYGTFPWQEGHPEIQDPNATDFTLLPAAALFAGYRDRFDSAFRAYALPHLRAGVTGLEQHHVSVDYTNIYVMNFTARIVLGAVLGDSAALARGASNLDAWLAAVAAHGFAEYDSPTYTSVQLECLLLGYDLARDGALKAKFRKGLDLLWTDVAANFFPARGTLSGPHSRDYDFLGKPGSIHGFYYVEGLTADPGTLSLNDLALMVLGELGGDYAPTAGLMALASGAGERIVRSRFGAKPGQDRYSYVTPAFVIGSAGAWYGPQDKPISVEVATVKADFPNVAVWCDRFDSPYGQIKTLDRSGHSKPTHLRDAIAAVQEKGTVLALLDAAPGLAEAPMANLATDIILPLSPDSALLDGAPISLSDSGLDAPVSVGQVFGFREGNAAVGVRIFRADGCRGQTASLRLKNDGRAWKAGRLAVYHYRGDTVALSDKRVRTGLILFAGRVDPGTGLKGFLARLGDSALRITQSFGADSAWQVAAGWQDVKLEASLSQGPVYRRVDGRDFEAAEPFAVAGQGWEAFAPVLSLREKAAERAVKSKGHSRSYGNVDDTWQIGSADPEGEGPRNMLGRRLPHAR